MANLVPATPRRILLIRLSAIGDVVFATPLIRAFRNRFPDAEIEWLVEPAAAPLLEHHPEIARLHIWNKPAWREHVRAGRWHTLSKEVRALIAQLRGCDWAIDLQGLLKSALWGRLSGAKSRIGLGCREGSHLLQSHCYRRDGGDSLRIGSEYLSLAEQLGLPCHDFSMEVALSSEASEKADALKQRIGDFTALVPFTTRPQKHWLESHWQQLIEKIRGPVVLLGGPGDREAASRLLPSQATAATAAINLVGETRLLEAAAIISRAQSVIGVDTALTHVGFAFRVPTVALFGSTRPYLRTPGSPGRILYHPLSCSPCRRHPSCDGRFDCMRRIETDEVLTARHELLAAESLV